MLGNRKKKGQLELVVIVGIVILVIIALILLMRQVLFNIKQPELPGLEEQKKLIKDSITNLIKVGTKETLIIIYNQGGYYITDEAPIKVKYKWFEMGVWSACDNITIPNVSKHIEYGISDYLRNNLRQEMVFYGKQVKFDFEKMDVNVKILKDKIDVEVNLPTYVENSEIPQPYRIEFESKLYDMIEFGKEYVKNVNDSKFFETIVLATMAQSNPKSKLWLPVSGTLFGSGKTLFKTKEEAVSAFKNIIKYAISHIVWQKEDKRLADNPFYPIDVVKGKRYDFDVMFIYPEEWELEKYFSMDPDPIRFRTKSFGLGLAKIGTYSVVYSAKFPVISAFKDNSFNQWFKIATIADIEDNSIGNCSFDFSPKETNYTKYCVNEAKCYINITVKNSTEDPISDADVFFYVCKVGKTDENGKLVANVPCMMSELKIYKDGYVTYGDLINSEKDDKNGREIKMLKIVNNLTIHFLGIPLRGVNYQGQGKYEGYWIYPSVWAQPTLIEDFMDLYNKELISDGVISPNPDQINLFTNEPTSSIISNIVNGSIVSSVIENEIYPVNYTVFAYVSDNRTEKTLGYVNYSVKIEENDKQLCIYLPVVLNAGQSINETEIEKLMGVLKDNGIEPVSTNCNYGSLGDKSWRVSYCKGVSQGGCQGGGEHCGAHEINDQLESVYNGANWRFDKIILADKSTFEFVAEFDQECERTYKLNTWVYLESQKTIKINVTGVDNCMEFFIDGYPVSAFMCEDQLEELWCRNNECGDLRGGTSSYCGDGVCDSGEEINCPQDCVSEEMAGIEKSSKEYAKGLIKFGRIYMSPNSEISITMQEGWHRITVYLYNTENTGGGFRFESGLEHFYELFDDMSSVKPP